MPQQGPVHDTNRCGERQQAHEQTRDDVRRQEEYERRPRCAKREGTSDSQVPAVRGRKPDRHETASSRAP